MERSRDRGPPLQPVPHTLYPVPCTLYPVPCTLYPAHPEVTGSGPATAGDPRTSRGERRQRSSVRPRSRPRRPRSSTGYGVGTPGRTKGGSRMSMANMSRGQTIPMSSRTTSCRGVGRPHSWAYGRRRPPPKPTPSPLLRIGGGSLAGARLALSIRRAMDTAAVEVSSTTRREKTSMAKGNLAKVEGGAALVSVGHLRHLEVCNGSTL